MKTITSLAVTAALVMGLASSGLAYEVITHRDLTRVALDHARSTIEGVLHRDASGPGDLDVRVTLAGAQRTLADWVVQGAADEDDTIRPLNHFHDPLRAVPDAGLFHTNSSSIEWMLMPCGRQNAQPCAPNLVPDVYYYAMSWNDGRAYYYRALTAPTPELRRMNIGLVFKALGHVMHLVQDASVPAHVRNDPHLSWMDIGDTDEFHTWAVETPANRSNVLAFANMTVFPDASILNTTRQDGRLPLANLIDGDLYDGGNHDELTVNRSTKMGIAEYANINFFSDDCIVHPDYDQPVILESSEAPAVGLRCDYSLTRLNVTVVDPLVCQIFMPSETGIPRPTPLLDEPLGRVYEAYARRLIPRAVGYSSAVPQYFFRGTLEAVSSAPDSFTVKNTGSEPMEGRFELFYERNDGTRRPVSGAAWDLTLNAAAGQALTFATPSDATVPAMYVVAFRGKLGGESDAVAGASFDGGCPPNRPLWDNDEKECRPCESGPWNPVTKRCESCLNGTILCGGACVPGDCDSGFNSEQCRCVICTPGAVISFCPGGLDESGRPAGCTRLGGASGSAHCPGNNGVDAFFSCGGKNCTVARCSPTCQ